MVGGLFFTGYALGIGEKMPYTNINSVKSRMPAFFKEDQQEDFLDAYSANLNDADIEAASIIDAALSVKYQTPFPDYGADVPLKTPDIIVTISNLLCRGQFLLDQYLGDGLNAEPKMAKMLYERGMALLQQLCCGSLNIPGAAINPSTNLRIWSSTYGKKSALFYFDLTSKIPNLHRQIGEPLKPFPISRVTPNFSPFDSRN